MEQTPILTPYERDWAMFANLAGLLALTHIPFASIIGPLICYLKVRDESEFATYHARNSLNFQITFGIFLLVMIFIAIVCWVGAAVTASGSPGFDGESFGLRFAVGAIVFGLVLVAAGITNLVSCILGAIAASSGRTFSYPLSITFVK